VAITSLAGRVRHHHEVRVEQNEHHYYHWRCGRRDFGCWLFRGA
jgi:hypothetical protein